MIDVGSTLEDTSVQLSDGTAAELLGRRPWPDMAVVRSAQAGDQASISVLIEGAHPHVRRFAASLCMSEQDAEDATQEALVILYRKIGTLRATGALASWMFTIVRNQCVRRWTISRRHVLAEVTDLPLGASSSAEDAALAGIEARLVSAAIARLPPDQRQVLLLRDVHGYSGRSVAKHLGLSLPAMKSRLHRARAALRAGLEEKRPSCSVRPGSAGWHRRARR